MKKRQNTFVTLLDLLKVKHTKSFSNQYFNEHPHKTNLFGLSNMLTDYGIHNAGTRIANRENDISHIGCPFVAQLGGDFVVVYKVEIGKIGESDETGKVHFVRYGKKIVIPISIFIQSWSGVILLAEPSPDSIEPDYKKHRTKEWLTVAQKSILSLACILLLGIAYINTYISPVSPISANSLGGVLLVLVNLLGIYICYLLVLKQLHIHSRYADKICSLFSKKDCNNILESDASKLWGIFGWSEIGLGYFATNTVFLLFLPHLISYLVIVNILSLPFTIWSVWYQKMKARQWCPLCLIVQILLWTIFIINLLCGHISQFVIAGFDPQSYSPFSIFNYQLVITVCCYAIPLFTLTLLIPKLGEGNQVEHLKHEINCLKANEAIFRTLLTQQPFYEATRSDSQILFGNPEARLKISILTNPFCNPCAKMHARVEKLLQETKGDVCVQYILAAFNESLEYANRYLIACYLQKKHPPLLEGQGEALRLFTNWFAGGKTKGEDFFKDLQIDISDSAIEAEFQKHESWKAKTQIRATPTILVNGYQLPANYKIEDLRYFTEFDLHIK